MSTPPRTPRALTCVELTTEGRLKLDRLTAAHDSHLMRVVVGEALDLLYATVFNAQEARAFVTAAIKYRYKENESE